MIKYADMKYKGDGIDVDKEKAAHYYKNAAEKDNDIAMLIRKKDW